VRLRPQPARVLEQFLVRHGGLVSREELRRSIWPDGTYVHFDRGLNSCIKQIRAALADGNPTTDYVETLVQRGFRFTAPVDPVAQTGLICRRHPVRRSQPSECGVLVRRSVR
jgi:DNA-binding winged helix-turn-helix (wHTH) protein